MKKAAIGVLLDIINNIGGIMNEIEDGKLDAYDEGMIEAFRQCQNELRKGIAQLQDERDER